MARKPAPPEPRVSRFSDGRDDLSVDPKMAALLDRLVTEEASAPRAFFEAARFGLSGRLRDHISANVPVNAIDPRTGATALHYIAACNGRAALNELVRSGKVDFNLRDRQGRLAFELCREPEMTEILLAYHLGQAKRDGVRLRLRP